MASKGNKGSKRAGDAESGPNKKERLDSGGESSQEMVLSPSSSTPTKQRIDFEYWGQGSQESGTGKAVRKLDFEPSMKFVDISDLEPGFKTREQVKFRVSSIEDGQKLFAIHGLDNSGEIRIVAFREQKERCSMLFFMNKVYSIHNFNVKEEAAQFQSGTGHRCNIIIGSDTEINSLEDDGSIQNIPFDFVALKDLDGLSDGKKIDIMGILVKDFGQMGDGNSRKRDICITDQSKTTRTITLWTNRSDHDFEEDLKKPIALRNAKVSRYFPKASINAGFGTSVWIDPDIEEAKALFSWFQAEDI